MTMLAPGIMESFRDLPRTPDMLGRFLARLTKEDAAVLNSTWDLWALPYQQLPDGDWRFWVARCGRGAGKTFTGGKTTNKIARDKASLGGGDIGIIARTFTDVRKTCIEGPSGILATAEPDFMPVIELANHQVVWPNGVVGHWLSADKPEGIRGYNLGWVWADEVCHWPGDIEDMWVKCVEFALRLGRAQGIITTTPLPSAFITKLEAKSNTVLTRASTYDNPWLPPAVLATFREYYEGTEAGAQELEGEILSNSSRLLWSLRNIDDNRIRSDQCPELARVVVAVDPAVTSNEGSDETGIISAGIATAPDGVVHGYVLRDDSQKSRPETWAAAAITAFRELGADYIVAEVNQGGDLVESTIRAVRRDVPYKGVHAKRGKVLRADPVSVLYKNGRVHHVGVHRELEQQQTTWIPGKGKSPDRVDAVVYALTELMLAAEDETDDPCAFYSS